MERKSILTSQKEIVKNSWKVDFQANASDEGVFYTYKGDISAETYCAFMSLDYQTVKRLGEISYFIKYSSNGSLYILTCETYIDNVMNERLSEEFEDSEDWLGLFTKAEIGKAQWLPSNWKELITDEQLHDILQERNIQTIECLNDDDVPDEMKERIAKDWCNEHSDELKDYLTECDKESIAYDYIEENPSDSGSEVARHISDYDAKELIKDLVDNL